MGQTGDTMYEVEITFSDGSTMVLVTDSMRGEHGAEAIREAMLDEGCSVVIFDGSR
ncbi:MAG: hypothetical protein ACRETN_14015 [Nevskiales bacterium]